MGHPRAGDKNPPGYKNPNEAKVSQTTENSDLVSNSSKQPTIPHSPHVCPTRGSVSLLFSTFPRLPHFPFEASTTRPNKKSQSLVVAPWHLGNQFPTIISPGENAHGPDNPLLQYPTGLTTRLFSPVPNISMVQVQVQVQVMEG
jgi:hypothetical protein